MNVSELIDETKRAVEEGMQQLLKTFAFVPEERLNWSPSPTARTPLQIVAHCGASNGAFAAILRGEKLQIPSDPKEAAAQVREGGKDIKTREGAIKSVQESSAAVLAALDAVTPEMASSHPDSPFGKIPFVFWMRLPGDHMKAHAHQIDYLETIWGDLDNH